MSQTSPSTGSIASRFAFSLGANISRALFSFLTGMLVARGLGPEQFGKMMFLLGTFTALRQVLDVGSSGAFFTFLSQRPRSFRFVVHFFGWLGVQFLLPLLAVGLLFPSAWIELIWKGEPRFLVLLAFLASYLQSTLWAVMIQMGESQRLTRKVQGAATTMALVHLLAMGAAWLTQSLSVALILGAMIIEWCVASLFIARQLHFSPQAEETDSLRPILKEFSRYCLPLIPYSWLGFAYEFADRWLLQNFSGSVQQAYYAIAFQFGALAGIATASILNVFWKEIAEAHQKGDYERVSGLYRKVSRGLYFLAISIAGGLAPWTIEILQQVLGPAYVGGASALGLMLFYPAHQSLGQVGGTMMYATGQVATQVMIGMANMLLSIGVTYFVLAPVDAFLPGLALGSTGLAGKVVLLQVLAVNVMTYVIARNLRIPFDWSYQWVGLLVCLALGSLARWVSFMALGGAAQIWLAMLLSGLAYLIMLAGTVWVAPTLAGTSRKDLRYLMRIFDGFSSPKQGG